MLPDGDIQLMKNVADSNKYVPIDLFQTTNALLATKLPKELIVNNKIISDILELWNAMNESLEKDDLKVGIIKSLVENSFVQFMKKFSKLDLRFLLLATISNENTFLENIESSKVDILKKSGFYCENSIFDYNTIFFEMFIKLIHKHQIHTCLNENELFGPVNYKRFEKLPSLILNFVNQYIISLKESKILKKEEQEEEEKKKMEKLKKN